MSCFKVLREEFRLKHFGFGGIVPDCLHTFMFRTPRIIYLIYRLVLPVYTLIWLIRNRDTGSGNEKIPWSAFLTNISYSTLNFHFVLHFVVSLGKHIYDSRHDCSHWIRRPEESEHHHSIQTSKAENTAVAFNNYKTCGCSLDMFPHIILIISQNVISVIAPMVTMVFWCILYTDSTNGISEMDIQFHTMNSVLVVLENFLTAAPVRILHVIYPIIYGLCYIIYTVIFWSGDHERVIYSILDWNKPGQTVGFVFLIGFVIIPVFHLLMYALYRLKVYLFCKYSPETACHISLTSEKV